MRPVRSVGGLALLLALAATRSASALEWTAIARSGDPATGLPGDLVFERFDVREHLGADGEVFFVGGTGGPTPFPVEPAGIFRWSEDATEMLASYGDDPSLDIGTPIRSVVNRHGDWAIADWSPFEVAPGCDGELLAPGAEKLVRSTLEGGRETLFEIGTSVPGAPDELRYAGIQRWGTPSATGIYRPSRPPDMNLTDSGVLLFGALLAADPCGRDTREAILMVPPEGALTIVALAGQPAPGAPEGFVLAELGLSPGALAQGGSVTFSATLQSATEAAAAIYRWTPAAGVELVAWSHEPVAATIESIPIEAPEISATDSIAWFESEEAWGPDGAGGVRRIFAIGDPVPGGSESAVFSRSRTLWRIRHPIRINASDHVAFVTSMVRPGETDEVLGSAVFRAGAGGPVELLVKTGDVAPGTGGAIFGAAFEVVAFGDAGEIVFSSLIDRTGDEDSEYESAVYLLDASGRTNPILLDADLAALGFAELSVLEALNASLGFETAFSRVAMSPYSYAQGDPDAVFVATIPEPSARDASLAVLLFLAATALTTSRKPPPA